MRAVIQRVERASVSVEGEIRGQIGAGFLVLIGVEEGDGDKKLIVITELPYQVNKAMLVQKIAELVKEKKIEGISDIRDESDRTGLRAVIEVKR